ncbi:MAG: outer membrane protein transport protein, partial [Pseudomonadota bacterium]
MKKKPLQARLLTLACGAAMTAGASQGHAAGFQLIEQSVSSMGTAYAGAAALAEDATTIYFNPAGMTRLQGSNLSGGLHLVIPRAEFSDRGSTHVLGGVGVTLGDDAGGDAGELKAAPNAFLTHQFNDEIYLGLGLNVPYGLATDYSRTWTGRYYAIRSEILTLNINPSLAYKVNEQFSLGIGVNAMYLDAELTNAIDFGSMDALGLFGLPPGALGLTPGASDGFTKVAGDGWGWGYNLGLLYELPQTRFGVSFRSKIDFDVSGDAKLDAPHPGLAAFFADTSAKSEVTLPWTLSLSMVHQLNPEWALLADYTRTGWGSLEELRFTFGNGFPDGVTTLKWEDSNRFSVGATYTPGSKWTYRAGLAFDESPIPNATYRTPRIPTGDRLWLAFGLGYQFSDNLSLDLGYAHLFIDDPAIDKDITDPENTLRGGLRG